MVKPLFLAVVLAFAASGVAYSSGMRVAFMDSFATTRGNAFAATADSPAAVFYNPGGLSQIEGNTVQAGTYLIRFRSDYTSPAGDSFAMQERYQPVPQLYYASGDADSNFSYGIGAYLPFGLRTEWPDEAPISFQATRSELRYLRVNPVIAWEAAPGLSIGGGPSLNAARLSLRRNEPSEPFDPNDPIAGQYRFRGDDTALGFNAGIHWHPHEQHAFGVSYHSPTRLRFSGTDRSGKAGTGGDASIDRLTFPEIAVAGYSYRPTPDWNIEVNVDWTRWSRFDSTVLRSGAGDDQPFDLDWKSTFFYGFGVTRYLPRGYHVNAGYLQTDPAVPSDPFWPAVPDTRFHFFSLGFGAQQETLSWHLGYHYAYGSERDIPGDPALGGMDGAGRYDTRIHGAVFTLTSLF